MERKYGFPLADEWIKEQLSDTATHKSMFQTGMALYAEMLTAIELDGVRDRLSSKTAGAFGGLVKTWKAGLVASRRVGRSIRYSATYPALAALIQFLLRDCCQGRPEVCEPAVSALLNPCPCP